MLEQLFLDFCRICLFRDIDMNPRSRAADGSLILLLGLLLPSTVLAFPSIGHAKRAEKEPVTALTSTPAHIRVI